MKERSLQLVERVVKQMMQFKVPFEVVEQFVLEQGKVHEVDTTELVKELEVYKREIEEELKQMESERGGKKKMQGAQKGIPDWLQELYDPLESIVKTGRDSTAST